MRQGLLRALKQCNLELQRNQSQSRKLRPLKGLSQSQNPKWIQNQSQKQIQNQSQRQIQNRNRNQSLSLTSRRGMSLKV